MRGRVKLFILVALAALVVRLGAFGDDRAPAAPTIVSAKPAPQFDALFQTKSGWVGGDAAYSVELGKGKILWFLGDSFIGSVKDGRRTDCVMINNAIGTEDTTVAATSIHFITGKVENGEATSFFKADDDKSWLWPQAGIYIEGKLYLFLPQIRKVGGGAFGFKQMSQLLATIDNPHVDPTGWHINYKPVPHCHYDGAIEASFGSALLDSDGYLYIYGYQQKRRDQKRLLTARAARDALADFDKWEFWTGEKWSRAAADAMPLADGLASEFSVTPSPLGKGFILVYTDNGLSDRIVARFADVPQGPWSEPTLLYTAPEMKQDKGVFCYSAKAHPWAGGKGELIISYCQNAWDFGHVLATEQIYRPRFVRISLAR